MKCIVTFIVVASLALGACADPPSAPSLAGRYERARFNARDNPEWTGVVGAWDIEFRHDGHFIVHGPSGWTVDSLWRLDGDVFTTEDTASTTRELSCAIEGVDHRSGRYRIRFVGDELQFKTLLDECVGRHEVLEGSAWRRVP